ncbi:MAG: phenylalanine--tRNA ligase subunit beta [Gammaproteobacteria bacterium]|nr:phenylalanine--tRNA ligase subunit beta [Gammaproteobacteria bacterium]
MRVPVTWLREWVNPPGSPTDWADKLTRGGVEAVACPLLPALPQRVVVGRITSIEPHPQVERLSVCNVDAGSDKRLTVVCGAPNVRVGLHAPLALPGARLPDARTIETTELGGVCSQGMLCSAAELGLAERSDGLLELALEARCGSSIVEHLQLDDWLLELELTPNRGDCASVLGVARELSALYGCRLTPATATPAAVGVSQTVEVGIDDPQTCPRYAGRALVRLSGGGTSPWWLRERLRRAGLRTIHPLVDVTNYVMLELGQPLHAFDLERLAPPISVRRAAAGERLQLLNEQQLVLTADDLLIADARAPLALAGVMGGSGSAVDSATTAIFLESACFDPVCVAGSGRRHHILSDARYRFERGVDPSLQRRALERASTLILQLCGGVAGPVSEAGSAPREALRIPLRQHQIERLLGTPIPSDQVASLLERLDIKLQTDDRGDWLASVPTHRYDLRIEADLVEEIGRLWGYERIAPRAYRPQLPPITVPETRRDPDTVCQRLAARGYREIVSYSFIDPQWGEWLAPGTPKIAVDNPIAETLAVMRPNLWPGLLGAWRYNRQRQTPRARLFELGIGFASGDDGLPREQQRLAALLAGSALPEQWGSARRAADLFDLKADIEATLAPLPANWHWRAEYHPALHPGRSARLYVGQSPCGWLGELHPQLAERLEVGAGVQLLDLDWQIVADVPVPRSVPLPEQPATRRDLALVVDEMVPAQALVETARQTGISFLREAFVFDAWRGDELEAGYKSIALGLIFQHLSRTLTDEEVDTAVAEITARLAALHRADLRRV